MAVAITGNNMENNNESKFFVLRIVDDYVKRISGNWWIMFLTGVAAVLLGICFLIWPDVALEVIAYFLGLFVILLGFFYIKGSFKVKKIEKNYRKMKEDIKAKFQ